VKDYVDFLVGKLYRSNVKVSLMKDGSAEEILRGNYDKVIFATWSNAGDASIKGIDQDWICGANDVLTAKKGYGRKVVVVWSRPRRL
jgi:2-enoate reductase